MSFKAKIKVLILIVLCLSAGFYFYQKWASASLWGMIFVIIFVAVPVWLVLSLRLWTRCPRCRKFGVIRVIATELRKKGVDPDCPPDDDMEDEETSCLDEVLDLYDIFCRYRCKNCDFEWEEKPPPTYRLKSLPLSNEDEKGG